MITSDLIIKTIQARAVIAPLARPITTAQATIPAAPLILIDVACESGIVGRSYVFGYTPVALRPIVETIANLNPLLCGKSVAPVRLAQELYATFRLLGRQGFLGMAIAGLDMAFWDALGQAADMSVARLLGGGDDPIRCYDSHGVFNAATSPAELEQSLRLGFGAVKFKVGGEDVADDIEAVRAIRAIIGPQILLMVDYNQSLDAPEAIRRVGQLSQFDLHWVEEPVPAEDFTGHRAVRSKIEVALQTGENWWFPEGAAQAIAARISDFAMLDIMKIGGVSGWMQAAALANGASMPVSSHIFIEASAHVMAATPDAHMLEYLDVASAVLADPLEIENGTLAPRGPGLGMRWNEKAIEDFSI